MKQRYMKVGNELLPLPPRHIIWARRFRHRVIAINDVLLWLIFKVERRYQSIEEDYPPKEPIVYARRCTEVYWILEEAKQSCEKDAEWEEHFWRLLDQIENAQDVANGYMPSKALLAPRRLSDLQLHPKRD